MAIITGTNASEIINGTSGGDIIAAGNGNDQVNGGAGNDLIDGGNGNDTINGGAGIDVIDGGNGDDTLDGGSGSDLLLGDNGNDILIYRSAENVGSFDIYDGGNGRDTLRLIVDPSLANSAAFQADIAALQAQLNHGSATYVFHSIGLAVTSIERLEVQVTQPTNHPAVIGDPTVHDVTEDVAVNGSGNLTAAGTIPITDPDGPAQAAFQTNVTGANGNLGTLQLASNGQYTYSVANNAVQFLGQNDVKVDTFTVTSVDGTTKQVNFTIHGANDAASIGDPTVHDVTEDTNVDSSGNLTASGTISISDTDQNQSAFQTTVTGDAGNLGSLQLAANGQYTYSVANSAVQDLGDGDTKVDTFTVTSVDGTTKQVSFTIHGQTDVIIGTPNDDTLVGTNGADIIQGLAGNDAITGRGGNDQIDGGDGVDLSIYSAATGAISVDLAAGTVDGDASVGHDTLTSIERVRGTNFNDSYTAAGYSGSGLPPGFPPTFNEFEGLGGDDQITGNGSTKVSYLNAAAAVTVDIAAGTGHGTAAGDLADVGNDTFSGVNSARGSNFNDTLLGSNSSTIELFEGRGGDDFIDGRGGIDRASYELDPTAAGITVNLAAGTVDGDTAIGHDTLRSIEAVRGTNFGDTYNAAGFTGDTAPTPSTNAGSQGNFNEFEGSGGDDSVTGNGNTRVGYYRALAAVTVDLAAGTAHGTASGDVAGVGNDTFVGGVNQVRGSSFNDTLLGSNASSTELFDGGEGDDFIDGRGGFDIARYDLTLGGVSFDSLGISVDMANGVVVGRDAAATAIVGTDTLRHIESVRGTNSDDVYNATGLTTSSLNAGDNGQNQAGQTFNEFEGMDGDDNITGNSNTRISYVSAAAGVTVNLALGTASGTVPGDLANVGNDIITGGVNGVRGSQFDDILTGTSGNDNFDGQGGNDTIDGGAGQDFAIFSGNLSQYTISSGLGGAIIVAGPDGTDTLTNIELLQFNDTYFVPGTSNISAIGLQAGKPINGGGVNNTLTVSPNQTNGHLINLDGGVDVLNLVASATPYNLNIQNVETVNGSGGSETVNLVNGFNGSIDLGAGTDVLNLSNAANTVNVNHVETVNGGTSTDIITLAAASSGVTLRLGGSFDILNLAAGGNDVTVNSVETISGNSGDDHVTLQADPGVQNINETFTGGLGNDTLTLNVFGTPSLVLTLSGVETVNSTGGIETVQLVNTATGMTVDLGTGFDTLNLANGDNVVTANNVETINAGTGNDTVTVAPDPTVTGLTVNLGSGANVLNLAGSNTTYSLNISGGNTTVNGSAADDHVTLTAVQFGNTFDLGDGGNDSLQLFGDAVHVNDVTVKNVETVIGTNDSDHIAIANTTGVTTVTGFLGSDFLTASAGEDHFRYTNYAESPSNSVTRDQITNFDASQDKFVFDGIGGMTTPVHYVDTAAFSGGGTAEARMENIGGQDILQVDGNGDGLGDMWIQLVNVQNGPLHDTNFLVI